MCSKEISKEYMLRSLTDSLQNKDFEEWNTTSFITLLMAIKGIYGEEVHNVGVELGDAFYNWYLESTNGIWNWFVPYRPKCGILPMPTVSEVRKMLDQANNEYICSLDKKE